MKQLEQHNGSACHQYTNARRVETANKIHMELISLSPKTNGSLHHLGLGRTFHALHYQYTTTIARSGFTVILYDHKRESCTTIQLCLLTFPGRNKHASAGKGHVQSDVISYIYIPTLRG